MAVAVGVVRRRGIALARIAAVAVMMLHWTGEYIRKDRIDRVG